MSNLGRAVLFNGFPGVVFKVGDGKESLFILYLQEEKITNALGVGVDDPRLTILDRDTEDERVAYTHVLPRVLCWIQNVRGDIQALAEKHR